jgi:hypothetical protein
MFFQSVSSLFATYDRGVVFKNRSFKKFADEDGNFTLEKVLVGIATVTVVADGFARYTLPVIISAETPSVPELVLEAEVAKSQIRGLIRSFNGIPVQAKLLLEPSGILIEMDSDGLFSMDVPLGKYSVTILATGHKSQTFTVVVEANGVSVINVELMRIKKKR